MQDLDKEIEELENEIFGTPGEESTEGATETDTSTLVVEKPEVAVDQAAEFQKRFNNYKASTDVTIRDLRSDLATQKMKYANLQKEYGNLRQKLESTSSKPKIFSEEEIDILGEPAANALDKGVRDILEAKIKPLQEEIAQSRKDNAERERKEADALLRQNYDKFIAGVARAVPDFAAVNVSPGFLQYMKGVDPYSGMTRESHFSQAEANLDVGRVVSFFVDYKNTLPVVKSGEQILQSAVTPTGTTGAESSISADSSKDPVITYAFIDKYYDDFYRGKYKTKKGREEALRIEALIDKAVRSNTVQ